MRKSFVITLVCAICVFAFQAFTTYQKPQWQNLEILPQDISEDAMDTVMHHFTASLGVKCGFCHVKNMETNKMEFAKDDKPEKLIARKMMLLAIDINKNHFTEIEEEMHDKKVVSPSTRDSAKVMLQYVTCYTCHQGKEKPVNIPPQKDSLSAR